MTNKTAEQIKRHEGLRLKAYLDTAGILTVGYGHNCKAKPVQGVSKVGDAISQELADRLFAADLESVMLDFRRNFPWALARSEPRQAVIINMIFNMGAGRALGFKKAWAAAEKGLYYKAAQELLGSRWAGQVGRRAIELSRQMEIGQWQ